MCQNGVTMLGRQSTWTACHVAAHRLVARVFGRPVRRHPDRSGASRAPAIGQSDTITHKLPKLWEFCMKTLLIVVHSRNGGPRQMAEAARRGAAGEPDVNVRLLPPAAAAAAGGAGA